LAASFGRQFIIFKEDMVLLKNAPQTPGKGSRLIAI
jgi:hypothetical protein